MKNIAVPNRFVELAKEWHGGQTTALYAVASSKKIPVQKLIWLEDEIAECYLDDVATINEKIALRKFRRWAVTQSVEHEEILSEIWDESDELL